MIDIRSKWALAKIGYKVGIKYRFHFFVSMITVPLSVLIYYFLWKSIFTYTGQEIIRGFTLEGMIQYFVLSMIVGFFVWADVDKWLSQDIRGGLVTGMLLQPMSLLCQYLVFEIGINSLGILIEMIPVFFIGFIFFGLKVAPLFNFTAFLVSVVLAFFLAFFVSWLVGLSAFWLQEISGLRRVKRTLMVFLSGGMLPLTFFPEVVQKIFHFLPFEYIRYVPIKIYQAEYSPAMVLAQLGIQFAWIIGLYFACKMVYSKAYKEFVGVGT